MRTVRLRISGRVQAVGYRAFVIDEARRLGLRGWVRNRRDGTVEASAAGAGEAVEQLVEACRHGPPAARVTEVAISEDAEDGGVGFEARPTV
jgi:acylphosphatase